MKQPVRNIILVYFALIGIILLFIFFVFSIAGCSILKTKKNLQKDSAHVIKQDSGRVVNSTNTSKNENEWWREYLLFNKPDTTIINVKPNETKYITQPAIIIREGGKQMQETASIVYDSSWKKAFDSLQIHVQQSQKTKETKTLTFWQLIGISCAGAVLLFILQNFKISKR